MFVRLLNNDKSETTVNAFQIESFTKDGDGSVITMESGRTIATTVTNRKLRSLLAEVTDNGTEEATAEAE